MEGSVWRDQCGGISVEGLVWSKSVSPAPLGSFPLAYRSPASSLNGNSDIPNQSSALKIALDKNTKNGEGLGSGVVVY